MEAICQTTARKIAGWFGGMGKAKREAEMQAEMQAMERELLDLADAVAIASWHAWVTATKAAEPFDGKREARNRRRVAKRTWEKWWNKEGRKANYLKGTILACDYDEAA